MPLLYLLGFAIEKELEKYTHTHTQHTNGEREMGGTLSSSFAGGNISLANQQQSPLLEGKTALVTGANSGVGYETALQLSQMGANVILACRSKEKGEMALQQMKESNPNGKFDLRLVDLSSLKDVERFAAEFNKEGRPLDILVNNAGIRNIKYELSVDGFESQIATNYLGHFALTGQLLPSLQKAKTPRVVSVGSLRAKYAKRPGMKNGEKWTRSTAHLLDVDFVKSAEIFNADDCYAESKCASLMFMRELGHRHPRILSVAGHPGGSATNILGDRYQWSKWFLQIPRMGALPIVKVASDPNILMGTYLGPRYGLRGYPATAWFPRIAADNELCGVYWEASVKATGVKY